jgi:hypothetical protein
MARRLNPLDQFIAARVAFRVVARPVVPTTIEEAAKLLGVQPDASESEVDRAYKALAFKNHPDLGGDADKMVEFNVARDLLKGDRTPSRPSWSGPQDEPYGGPPPVKREWKKTVVTFEEALASSGVPSNVKWIFATNTGHGDYDMGAFSISGIVYYGTTDTEHVFLSIRRESGQNAFSFISIDAFHCESKTVPLSQPIATVAPKMIRVMFDRIDGLRKGYNAKVTILPDNLNLKSVSSPMYPKGKEMSFKDALVNLGLVGDDHAWKTNQKISVVFSYSEVYSTRAKTVTLDINGKSFELSQESTSLLFRWPQMLKAIYGDRPREDQKKTLTRNTKGKEILTALAEKLTSEPQELRDLLTRAAEQMK